MCTGPHDFIPAAETAKVEMRYTWDDQHVENVLHFTKEGGWDGTSLAVLAQNVAEGWLAELQGMQAPTVTLREIYVRDMEVEAGAEATFPVGTPGNAEGVALPNNVSLALSFRTGLSGRSNRGRIFWIGLLEGQVIDNTVQPTPLAAIVLGFRDFIEYVETETEASLVVVSYCSENVWRTNAQVTPVTTILVTDPTIDSMRRRLPGRGG